MSRRGGLDELVRMNPLKAEYEERRFAWIVGSFCLGWFVGLLCAKMMLS